MNFAKTRLGELNDAAVLALLKERGIYVSPAGSRLKISAPPGALDESLRAELSRRKPALLALLSHCTSFGEERPLEPMDSSGPI
ncbi:MAG: hypothetical protein ACRD5L_01440, partial [Bryobacteraceae bacterium]